MVNRIYILQWHSTKFPLTLTMPPVRSPPHREHNAYLITNTKWLLIFTEIPVYCEDRTKLKHTVWLKNAMLLNAKIDGFCNCHYALKGLLIRIIHRHSMFATTLVGVVWCLSRRNLWSIINLKRTCLACLQRKVQISHYNSETCTKQVTIMAFWPQNPLEIDHLEDTHVD
jgi:hypothetical protein